MPGLVTCKFDDDPIKNEGAKFCPQHFLHHKYIRNFFGAQGRETPKLIVRYGRNRRNSSRIMSVLVTCKFHNDPTKK